MILVVLLSAVGMAQSGVRGTASSATWTTSTALNTVLSYDLTNTQYEGIYVYVSGGASLTAGAVTFEAGPSSASLTTTQMTRTDSSTNDGSYTLVSGTKQGWTGSVGPPYFQVRLSTAITTSAGVGTTTVTIIPYSFPNQKDVVASVSSSGNATSSNQTSGAQKSQICDASANCAPVDATLGVKVQASIDTTGLSTSAKQDTGNTSLGTIVTNTTGAATSAKQDTGNTSLGSIKTDVDTLAASGGGGYVRQDSTATIAKESGGNLATIAGAITGSKFQDNVATIAGTIPSLQSLGAATLSTIGSGLVIDNFNYYGDGTPMLNTDVGIVKGNLTANGAASAGNRIGTLPGIARTNMPSALTSLRDQANTIDAATSVVWTGNLPTGLTTFVAAGSGTLAATPGYIATLPGNATNTVVVSSVIVSCTQTTAGMVAVRLSKLSSAPTGGTSSAMTVVPLDSGNAAGVSAPLFYTANSTGAGALLGDVDSQRVGWEAPATASANDIYIWTPKMGQSIVLRGTAQVLAVNIAAQTVSGAICSVSFQWIETTGL